MKKETWLVMLGCAIGAFIGGLSAFEIQSRLIWGQYLWILGAFTGGVIGWCMGEFGELKTSIERSYSKIEKRELWTYLKATAALIAGFTVCLISSVLLIYVVFLFAPQEDIPVTMTGMLLVLFCAATIIVSFFGGLFSLVFLISIPFGYWRRDDKGTLLGCKLLKFGNPIVLPFFITWKSISFLWEFASCLWEERLFIVCGLVSGMKFTVKEVSKFFVRVFIYAHSEKRRIRFIGAFLGTVAGFFLGSAILGAVAGAIIGGISREIAIRWLKLVPSV